MDKIWVAGHINPWWNNLHRKLNYQNEPFNNTKDTERWRTIGFTHDQFTGDMYDMRNSVPSWMDLDRLQKEFQFEYISWSFYCMTPGVILPEHVDTFNRFKQLYNTKNKVIVRALIMLEDWHQGHYLDMDGTASTNWKAGDYYIWEEACPHCAANIGTTNRYTLQLTGLLNKPLTQHCPQH